MFLQLDRCEWLCLQGPTQQPYPLKISLEGQPSVGVGSECCWCGCAQLPAVSRDTLGKARSALLGLQAVMTLWTLLLLLRLQR